LRIAIVTQAYYPQKGGVSEHVHHTAVELRKLGHATDVITSRFGSEKGGTDGVLRVGNNILVPCLGAFANMNAGPRLAREIGSIFHRNEYDVVHVHEPLCPTLPWIAVEHAPEEAVVAGTFHSFSPRAWGYRVFRPFLRRYAHRLDARIAVSLAASRCVSRCFEHRYQIIPNGVDPQRFRPGLGPLEAHESDRPTILFVGRFYPRKGIPVLFTALSRIVERVPNVRVLVVGGGPLGPWYRSLARRTPCEIRFLGELSAEEIPLAYHTADVLVAPSTGQESFGIVHLEAMASGIPIVASDIEGYREILDHGREALLFSNRDPASLAQAVIRVLTDRPLARAMGATGVEKARRYSWSRITREIEGLYLELLDRKRRFQLAS
jgi:phosphatidylinositol alpha-mannosyltransferase